MKYLKFIPVLLLLFQHTLKAQEYSREFGKIGKAEADLVTFLPDKTAEAVVLFDIGKSFFIRTEDEFDIIFERTTRIKIFSDAGIKWAEIEIPIYQKGDISEKVYDIEAYSYNPNGEAFSRTKLNTSASFEEEVNEFWHIKKFALPDVKAGSIIEYRYKINSNYKFNLRDWEFQKRIPTIYSEYEVKMIPFYDYTFSLQGTNKFDSNTVSEVEGLIKQYGIIKYKELVHNFIMKDVPAFNEEEYLSSINDYIIKLDFQLAKINFTDGFIQDVITNWPDLVKMLLRDENVTRFSKKIEKLSAKLYSPDTLLNKSQKEKFDFILDYVKANFSWNKINGKYASKTPIDLLNDKIGNTADLNLLTIGLLNAAGIEAYPLLISTRDHGKIKLDYPYPGSFNYVIINALVDGKSILSDATEVFCPNGRIPSRCINDQGLLIKEGPVSWVSLQSNILSEKQLNFKFDSIGKVSLVNTMIVASEYDALGLRNLYGDDKKKIAEMENMNGFLIDESSIKILNNDKKARPYIMQFNTACNTETINRKIYLSPFLDEPITDNPLKQNSRVYPIDMSYPVKRTYNSIITIPAGYKADFLPENYTVQNDFFELAYNVRSNDEDITITFSYVFKKAIYDASEYINLQAYFNDIIKKGNEKVVLIPI